MAKTVVLSDLVITRLEIDYFAQNVKVNFDYVDASGTVWQSGDAYFWVTIPIQYGPGDEPLPTPDNYFLLPPSYIPILLGLRDDADTALTAKFLV